MKQGIKRFFIYLFVLIAIFVACILVCFAIMYFSPGTEILGYQYVLYNQQLTKSITPTELSSESVNSIKLTSTSGNITIRPNGQSENIEIIYNQSVSGITKSINAEYAFDYDFQQESYEENDLTYSSVIINIAEPTGWTVNSSSNITVLIPSDSSYSVIFAQSGTGNINYLESISNEDEVLSITTSNLYLYTGSYGNIAINTSSLSGELISQIDNYNLKTENGEVTLNSTYISADNFNFKTNSGRFNYSNSNSDATLYLTDGLNIEASGNPIININKIDGNINIVSNEGSFSFNNLGSVDKQNTYLLNFTKANFTATNVYGFISLLGNGGDLENNIKISSLSNSYENTNVFNIGKGSLVINNLIGDTSISSTSGRIEINNIDIYTSIYAYSDSGEINVNYNAHPFSVDNTDINIFSNTGNINLSNISGRLKIDVLKNSASASLNIVFSAISKQNVEDFENIIEAKDRNVSITLRGVTNDFRFRVLSTSNIQFSDNIRGISSRIESNDNDSLLGEDKYSKYLNEYRIGYEKGLASAEIERFGRLLINTTNNIFLYAQNS